MPKSSHTRGGWGGRRAGAGRVQQRITLSLGAANLLREIVRLHTAQARQDGIAEFTLTPAEAVGDLVYAEALRLGALAPESAERWRAAERGDTP